MPRKQKKTYVYPKIQIKNHSQVRDGVRQLWRRRRRRGYAGRRSLIISTPSMGL
uniref:Uncharacterized protein n=1 Tax=Setaria italica TaxID=4555 RepID=K3XUF6_SETIT